MKRVRSLAFLAILIGSTMLAFASDKTAVFQGTTNAVFNAAQSSAQKWWTLSFSDRNTHLMSFVTGRSFASHGMACSVALRPLPDGKVEVVLHTQKQGRQIYAFGSGDRIAKKFFGELRNELPKEQASADAGVPPSAGRQ